MRLQTTSNQDRASVRAQQGPIGNQGPVHEGRASKEKQALATNAITSATSGSTPD